MTQDRKAARRQDESRYRSYLLRLWQEAPGDADRVVLQDVVGGETRGFPSLESLFAYLNASRGQADGDKGGDHGRGEARDLA
jgi:hypothetical protein